MLKEPFELNLKHIYNGQELNDSKFATDIAQKTEEVLGKLVDAIKDDQS